jgi:hypothetical protein
VNGERQPANSTACPLEAGKSEYDGEDDSGAKNDR